MIPPETFREYLRRIDPAWELYQKELRTQERSKAGDRYGLSPYSRFRRASKPDMDWLLAEVARLRGDGA